MKYIQKPIVVEAFRLDIDDVMPDWFSDEVSKHNILTYKDGSCEIFTLEGDMIASKGDYIVKGSTGKIYTCKPDIFEKMYDVVLESKLFIENNEEG
jgi:hypothetical protein